MQSFLWRAKATLSLSPLEALSTGARGPGARLQGALATCLRVRCTGDAGQAAAEHAPPPHCQRESSSDGWRSCPSARRTSSRIPLRLLGTAVGHSRSVPPLASSVSSMWLLTAKGEPLETSPDQTVQGVAKAARHGGVGGVAEARQHAAPFCPSARGSRSRRILEVDGAPEARVELLLQRVLPRNDGRDGRKEGLFCGLFALRGG